MTFFEVCWMGEGVADAGDFEEALACYLELRPAGLGWQEVCADPAYSPLVRSYRSFDAFLDNEEAIETIPVTAAMLEAAATAAGQAPGS